MTYTVQCDTVQPLYPLSTVVSAFRDASRLNHQRFYHEPRSRCFTAPDLVIESLHPSLDHLGIITLYLFGLKLRMFI